MIPISPSWWYHRFMSWSWLRLSWALSLPQGVLLKATDACNARAKVHVAELVNWIDREGIR